MEIYIKVRGQAGFTGTLIPSFIPSIASSTALQSISSLLKFYSFDNVVWMCKMAFSFPSPWFCSMIG